MTKTRWTIVPATLVLLGVCAATTAATTAQASAPRSANPDVFGPVYSGNFPDPSILVVGNTYYAYSTQSGGSNIPVMSSDDLVHWDTLGDALPTVPTWASSGFTWAPAVTTDPEVGYEMFFATHDVVSNTECIGRATSTSPTGPFVDTSTQPFLCQPSLGGSIDPYAFSYQGAEYLIWKSDGANGSPQRLWSQRLGADQDSLQGEPSLLLSATSSWEDGVVEGPAMLQTNQGLFLYFSGSSWSTSSYSIGVVGCDSPLGPCVSAPTGQAVSTLSHVVGPGGPTFFVAIDGQEMMAFAAWSGIPGTSTGRRRLYIDGVDTTGTVPTLIEMPLSSLVLASGTPNR